MRFYAYNLINCDQHDRGLKNDLIFRIKKKGKVCGGGARLLVEGLRCFTFLREIAKSVLPRGGQECVR